MTWNAPADRGNKLAHDKGLGHQSSGAAGQVVSFRSIDRDTKAAITSLLAQGFHRERVAARTGAPLQIVRIIETAFQNGMT